MKRFSRQVLMLGLVMLGLVMVSPGLALGQDARPAPSVEPREQDPPGAAQDVPRVITGLQLEGELSGVDPDLSLFLVTGEDGQELLLYYDEQTVVRGGDQGVQGLTGQTGTWLRIQYRAEGTRAIAETVETVPRGSNDEPAAAVEPDR